MIKTFSLSGHSLSWIFNSKKSSYEEADVIVLEGGADWNPRLYNEKPNRYVNWLSESRDAKEWHLMELAKRDNKIIFGICRGLQGLTIFNGGKLVQHINHPGYHTVYTNDGQKHLSNSLHHQMCNPFNLPEKDYVVLGYTKGLSSCYLGEREEPVAMKKDEQGFIIEPEIIYFPKTKSLGAQYHPEMMPYDDDAVIKCNAYIQELFKTGTIK